MVTGQSTALCAKRLDWLPYVAGGVTIFILVSFLIYPIGKTMLSSFIPNQEDLSIANLTFSNFERFSSAASYRNAFTHSVVVSLATTFFALLIGLPAAFAVSRISMPFRGVIIALSVIPLISPPFIGAYSWVILLGRSGIVTHYLRTWLGIELPSIYGAFGIILALSLSYFPYVFLIVQGALAASDPYIEESAHVMGSSRWRILRTVTFPLVTPAISAGAIIVFIKALGNFGVPAILGGEYYVLPTLIYFQIHGFFNLNGAAAIAMVNVGLTLIAILVLIHANRRRRFVTVTSVTRRAKLIESRGAKIFANTYCWALLFAALLPQMVVIFSSFAEQWAATLFPTAYGFANYGRVLTEVTQPILNSLTLAGTATILCVVFGTLAAYASIRGRFFGKWALDMTIMLPFVLPGIVTGVAFLTTFNDGLVVLSGTATILVLAYFVRRIAYTFRSVAAAMSQMDDNLEEASTVCGATWLRTMRKVTIPLTAPGIIAGAIIVFATLISEMSVTIILYSAKWKTVSIAIFELVLADELMDASAIGTVVIVLTLGLVFLSSRLLGKSMADLFR
jgi:iron(III) transport system permease protein